MVVSMSLKTFLKFVEIQTKLASVFPFALGILFSLYLYGEISLIRSALMFISLELLDMAVTGVNNYSDFKNAARKNGYGYEIHNAMARDSISPKKAKTVIFLLLLGSAVFGAWLTALTGWVTALTGLVASATGFLYSAGPFPTNLTPLSEVVSGTVMGFAITFLAVHISGLGIIGTSSSGSLLQFTIHRDILLKTALFSTPSVFGISNIMLANNICDMEDDRENGRFTLPLLIGKKRSVLLFAIFTIAQFTAIALLAAVRVVPSLYLLSLFSAFIVLPGLRIFLRKQSKSETFVVAVKNFTIIEAARLLCLALILICYGSN